MPSIADVLARFTNQTAVYWRKVGTDKFGQPAYFGPVEVSLRWEDGEHEIISPSGRKVIAKGRLLIASRLEVGSLIFLGSLTDWQAMPTYPQLPTFNQGGREVILLKQTPDIDGVSFVYEAYV